MIIKNFIQTLYIERNKNPFFDSLGWASPEYHLMGWALSCLQLHKLYGTITLYANSKAAYLLRDTLQLPYSEVNVELDKLNLVHPNLWALPKIHTYSLQKKPFLHVDGDVFLFKPFSPDFLEGDLIAQNIEIATEYYYTQTQKELMSHFSFFPVCVKKDFESGIPIQATNAGILGGINMSFFFDYVATAFEYVYKNVDNLKKVNVERFNVFFEQHLFYALAKEKGLSINVLINEIVNDNGYKYLGDFHDIPFKRSYLHLLGHFKRDEMTCIQMAAKLRELYPDYYERITVLFRKKNIQLSPCGFINHLYLEKCPNFSYGGGSSNEIFISKKPCNESKNTHLQRLILISQKCPLDIDEDLFKNDFDKFYNQLKFFLKNKNFYANLKERDLSAQHWYRCLFSDPSDIFNQVVIRCNEAIIIESSLDWGGLFNKNYRVGAEYYSDIQTKESRFFNLLIKEATDNGFSLYDINEIDNEILLFLSEPLSIKEVLIKMKEKFENDVILNYYAIYENLILSSIMQLVIKKAVKPFSE